MEVKLKGLSTAELIRLREEYGPNILPEKPPPPWWQLLLAQLKNPLVYVLLLAAVVTFFLHEYADSLIILLAVAINTILGFIQEQKASQALYALKHHLSAQSLVIRDGQRQQVDSSQLVPGDLVILNQGVKIPADGQLIFANRFFANEAEMTGETAAVTKGKGAKVLMGTTVAAGQGIMKVEMIGSATKLASIALGIQTAEQPTVLQQQLKDFSQKLVKIILVLVLLTFVLGLLRGSDPVMIFTTAVALAVSSIPEGLLVSMTVILALGMQRILRKRGLVKRLLAAETLGGVTVICCDKTGTLTLGEMRVVKTSGSEKKLAQQLSLANDLDDPMLVAAYDWAKKRVGNIADRYSRLDSLPFSPREKFFASLHNYSKEENWLLVNGAPEVVMEWTTLNRQEKKQVLEEINRLSNQGMRVLACAQKKISSDIKVLNNKLAKESLQWLGLVAFNDPVRTSVASALAKTEQAGIRIVVITGDYLATTKHVLADLGRKVKDEACLVGDQLLDISQEELSQKIKGITVFARTTPDQKLRIVNALKANGEVVAMMGDGVNDAPALHQADIGVVVAEATDVAKESADLVLLDSNFQTVVAAIKEGRAVFENIRKVIIYLLNDSFGEIVLVTLSIVLHLPLPITAVQILWVNLVSDGLPDLALTVDPADKNLMQMKPRSSNEFIVNKPMVIMIIVVSLLSGLTSLSFFLGVYHWSGGDEILARSAAFASLGLDSLLYVFAVRNIHRPFWQINLLANKWLNRAVFAGLLLQLLPFSLPALREFFDLKPLSIWLWLIALLAAILLFLMVELFKWIYFDEEVKKDKAQPAAVPSK